MTYAEQKCYEAHLETINPRAMKYSGIYYCVCNLRDISRSLETVYECARSLTALLAPFDGPVLPEAAAFIALGKSQTFFAQDALAEFVGKAKKAIESALTPKNACENVEDLANAADKYTSQLCSIAAGYAASCKEYLYRIEAILERARVNKDE